jgi:serine/threonine protein kinase
VIFYAALLFLHSVKVVHGDLKLENVMIDSSNDVKLIDFGFSKIVVSDFDYVGGTAEYFSPEKVMCLDVDPYKQDIWAMGVLAFAIIIGRMPFDAVNNLRTLFRRIAEADLSITPSEQNQISCSSHSFLLELLQKDSQRRPSLTRCLQHQFFNE